MKKRLRERERERGGENQHVLPFVLSISDTLPSNQLSTISWRRFGVKYTTDEAYFDIIEEVDAIIDRNCTTVMCEIQGYVSEIMLFVHSCYHCCCCCLRMYFA